MIKSMTGFGRGEASGETGTVSAEIRSLNHKYFDIVSRLPNHLSLCEDKIREYLKKKVKRGRLHLAVSWESKKKAPAAFSLDMTLAKKYHRELLKLQRGLKLKDDLGLTQIIALPEVLTCEQKKEDIRRIWPYLHRAIEQAWHNLDRMRQAEGRRLMRDLLKRTKKIRQCLHNIENHLPQVIERYRKNLLQKVKALSGAERIDQDRIAEEVALFVRNSDVSEELTRINSHLKAFKMALNSKGEAGKELDFVAQELFREANTIGAKSGSFRISRWVIKMKSQIEKMREQLQNVE